MDVSRVVILYTLACRKSFYPYLACSGTTNGCNIITSSVKDSLECSILPCYRKVQNRGTRGKRGTSFVREGTNSLWQESYTTCCKFYGPIWREDLWWHQSRKKVAH